jgi:hypothetical protein
MGCVYDRSVIIQVSGCCTLQVEGPAAALEFAHRLNCGPGVGVEDGVVEFAVGRCGRLALICFLTGFLVLYLPQSLVSICLCLNT